MGIKTEIISAEKLWEILTSEQSDITEKVFCGKCLDCGKTFEVKEEDCIIADPNCPECGSDTIYLVKS